MTWTPWPITIIWQLQKRQTNGIVIWSTVDKSKRKCDEFGFTCAADPYPILCSCSIPRWQLLSFGLWTCATDHPIHFHSNYCRWHWTYKYTSTKNTGNRQKYYTEQIRQRKHRVRQQNPWSNTIVKMNTILVISVKMSWTFPTMINWMHNTTHRYIHALITVINASAAIKNIASFKFIFVHAICNFFKQELFNFWFDHAIFIDFCWFFIFIFISILVDRSIRCGRCLRKKAISHSIQVYMNDYR